MTQPCYDLLYQCIISFVGKSNSKDEAYIDAFLKENILMYNALSLTTWGYISGEVALAVTLRLFAVINTMNFATIFDIYSNHCTFIMHKVFDTVDNSCDIGMLNMTKHLEDNVSIERVSIGFLIDSKCIRKNTGWLVSSDYYAWRDKRFDK